MADKQADDPAGLARSGRFETCSGSIARGPERNLHFIPARTDVFFMLPGLVADVTRDGSVGHLIAVRFWCCIHHDGALCLAISSAMRFVQDDAVS